MRMPNVEAYQVYKAYLAFKLHFTTDDYDIVKTKGAVKTNRDSFLKRRDVHIFRKLSDNLKDDDVIRFFISNLSRGDKWGGVFSYEEAMEEFHRWKGKIQKLTKLFSDDLDIICNELADDGYDKFDKGYIVKQGQHPLLLRVYASRTINIETMVILNVLTQYHKYWSKYLAEDIYWNTERRRIVKYQPFLSFDVDKMKTIYESRKAEYDLTQL
jgi:hypothetical protein